MSYGAGTPSRVGQFWGSCALLRGPFLTYRLWCSAPRLASHADSARAGPACRQGSVIVEIADRVSEHVAACHQDWPDSVTPDRFPSTFQQLQPTSNGRTYPQNQFVTDASATEFNTNCNPQTGTGCVLPPQGPGNFYPYFTQATVSGQCAWEFGNMRNGNSFGGDAQYGSVTPDTLGAFASPIRGNPNCQGPART
jgi:hypothetical protein